MVREGQVTQLVLKGTLQVPRALFGVGAEL